MGEATACQRRWRPGEGASGRTDVSLLSCAVTRGRRYGGPLLCSTCTHGAGSRPEIKRHRCCHDSSFNWMGKKWSKFRTWAEAHCRVDTKNTKELLDACQGKHTDVCRSLERRPVRSTLRGP
uniref:Uncharacterized protein n=1 Tax=Trypanosoma vivax (strain Y486) TaxID=1055687 RepID=G0U5H3_TRYVY|nr:hypothetical protein, unlikely [Trypanosoma vivax Y486]